MVKSVGFSFVRLLDANGKLKVADMEDLDSVPSSGFSTFANFASFPTSPNAGDIVLNEETRLYHFWDGTSWKRLEAGDDNSSTPKVTTIPPTTLDLNIDGSTNTISIVASDSDGDILSYSYDISQSGSYYSPERGSSLPQQLTSIAAGYETTGNFVLTPSTNSSHAGNFIFRSRVTDGIKSASVNTTVNLAFSIYDFDQAIFTTGGVVGKSGPTISQAKSGLTVSTYSDSWKNDTSLFNVTNGIQKWKVPDTATYRITARGGDAITATGGGGAQIRGDFALTRDEYIYMIVGQRPKSYSSTNEHSGAGGSFVVKQQGNSSVVGDILVIAGGGGGSHAISGATSETHGQAGTAGGKGTNNVPGGTNGSGGSGSNSSGGGGGGGFLTNGTSGTHSTGGGKSWKNLGTGGYVNSTYEGGFGGGGAHGNTHGGGGGGYSGGGGSINPNYLGGGGGSYNSGTNQLNQGNAYYGASQITIQ